MLSSRSCNRGSTRKNDFPGFVFVERPKTAKIYMVFAFSRSIATIVNTGSNGSNIRVLHQLSLGNLYFIGLFGEDFPSSFLVCLFILKRQYITFIESF